MKPMHYSEPWNDAPAAPKIEWTRVGLLVALIVGGAAVWGFAIFGGIAALGGG